MKPFALPVFITFWSLYFHTFLFFTSNFLRFQPCRARTSPYTLRNENTDHLSLIKFKESISNDPYGILDSWNASTHFCNWQGIICSNSDHRVIELGLGGYHLHGFISPHLANLSFLMIINFSNNYFHGEIPQEFGGLFKLEYLYLSNNTLSGKIPNNITSCIRLRHLWLNGNNLSGSIPVEIGSLQKLEVLLLYTNKLTGQIPTSMWNLSSLVDIDVSFNHLEGNLPEEIGLLNNLDFLELTDNNFFGTFPSSLYNLSHLTDIEASINYFNGSLPPDIFHTLPHLEVLRIAENKFSGPFPSSFANASALRVLELAGNNFAGQFQIIGSPKNLRLLDLSESYQGTSSSTDLDFLSSLINCSYLNILDIGYNDFGGHLPHLIGNLSTQLTDLYLGGNNFSGEIPETIGNLVNLIALGLENNHFTGTIPSSFTKFRKMQALTLQRNQLSGNFPAYIGNLSQLYGLDLSNNLLEAEIPPSIENCQILNILDLSRNNLSGAIPPQVFRISSLIFLNLSQNSLTGTLPLEVGKLQHINTLDLSENEIFGRIPEAIGGCMSLEYLDLRGNSFHEAIPSYLASLSGLQYLDLSLNNLSGSIPVGLEGISALEYLNVSFNMLDGMVPNKGIFSNASAISVTGNSKLCGGIPELQLPPCHVKVTKRRKCILILSSLTAFLLLVSCILMIYFIRRRNKKPRLNLPTIGHLYKVSYRCLYCATNGFSESNLIGSGGFGHVYRGSIDQSEEVVAIKVLNLGKKGADKSFLAECNALKNIRHRNLVRILTCCSCIDYKGHDFKALVFEYMPNGSLEKWLHPVTRIVEHTENLVLDQRLSVIIDVASALHYLHYECEQPIVHCDLKPSNVLLDDDMVAHLSDFGLARFLSNKQTSTVGIKGTIGYAPPEYGMGFEVSREGDVYSFGILVLELLTGRRPTEEIFKDGHNLHNYVKVSFPDKLFQIVDQTIIPREIEQVPHVEKCMISLFRIGLACSIDSPKERMSMTDVTRELNSIRNGFLSSER